MEPTKYLPFLLLFPLLTLAEPPPRVRIDPATGQFIAPDGRTKVFHGVNVVQKAFPWHPSIDGYDAFSSLVEQDMDDLKRWGFNAIRLGVMWPGVEPVQGQYNMTYLKVMRKIVDDLYEKGIYTIVDFHQDAFSQLWCGEGVPTWLIELIADKIQHKCRHLGGMIGKIIGQCTPFAHFNITKGPDGYPEEAGCLTRGFDMYSRTPEVNSAWDHFYHEPTIQSLYQKMWRTVASQFATAPGVLGYDLINEPLNANFFSNNVMNMLKPGWVDKNILQPMYTNVFKVIKDEDPQAIAFYEPTPFPDTYPSNQPLPYGAGVHSAGFTTGAGTDAAHQSLSYHYYSCGFAAPACNSAGDMEGHWDDIADRYAEDTFIIRPADAKLAGGAAFLTEFGACSGSDACLKEIERTASRADAVAQSWAYWQFKYNHDITTVSGPLEGFYDNHGNLQTRKVAALSRTYAPSIAGTPVITQFSSITGAYHLRYVSNPVSDHLPTDVFLNEEYMYPDGYNLVLKNAVVAQKTQNHLSINATAPDAFAGPFNVDVLIVPSKAAFNQSGWFHSKDNDWIKWEVHDRGTRKPGFDFVSSNNVTWWKQLNLIGDDGKTVGALQTQDGKHTASFDLLAASELMFVAGYKIEVWKAKMLGQHKQVDTMKADLFGPLLDKRVVFTWVCDTNEVSEIVV